MLPLLELIKNRFLPVEWILLARGLYSKRVFCTMNMDSIFQLFFLCPFISNRRSKRLWYTYMWVPVKYTKLLYGRVILECIQVLWLVLCTYLSALGLYCHDLEPIIWSIALACAQLVRDCCSQEGKMLKRILQVELHVEWKFEIYVKFMWKFDLQYKCH